jgi:2-polyprenyl-6-methoxyphenol hydroxylase-like FAD-dependent oxidoreductase
MPSAKNRPHVLILGAGLGGLTLAQTLRKRGITFEVFERDASIDARFQGWAIALAKFAQRRDPESN